MLWKLKRKLLGKLSEFLRNCSDAINEYLWRDAEAVWVAVEQLRAPDLLRVDPRSAIAHPTSDSTADNRPAKSATSG